MQRPTLHLIPNAHLDPVWLWDQREGMNEGIATCRTVVKLMEANPDLTFIRGEAAVYEHLRNFDPKTFDRILSLIHEGRWDVVGGTWIQPDTNLPAAETLCRQFDVGLRWIQKHLGVQVRCGWQADSFGHSAGLPAILHSAGIKNFAFTRPPAEVLPLRNPAFWWESRSGARILAYRPPVGWYGCERDELPRRLDAAALSVSGSPLRHLAVFLGLGNHGGGPSQRLIDDARTWADSHPEFEVRFSGLHTFFDALRNQLKERDTPELERVRGELNFCLRGCYASVAKIKHAYRRAEHNLLRTERTAALLHQAGLASKLSLENEWTSLLFNSFHDILPGSSIERAMDEQADEIGAVSHRARQAGFHVLNGLAQRVRVVLPATSADHPSAVPVLLWNPHLYQIKTFVAIEVCLDHRPIAVYKDRPKLLPVETRLNGRPVTHQVLATEHESFVDLAWRKRVIVPVTLSPAGWSVVSVGWVESPNVPAWPTQTSGKGTSIRNDFYRIRAQTGRSGIEITHRGKRLFGLRGLHLVTVADKWGSWGPMDECPEGINLREVIGSWRITRVEVTEAGPLRSALAVRLVSDGAWANLVFHLTAGVEEIGLEARVFSDLEAARIKLVLPGANTVEAGVPGETVVRKLQGEQPVLGWVRASGKGEGFTIASDVLSAADLSEGDLRFTLLRATRYARDGTLDSTDEWWRPTVDRGEARINLALAPYDADIHRISAVLSEPPLPLQIWSQPEGTIPSKGSLASVLPRETEVLSLRSAENESAIKIRLRNPSDRKIRPRLCLGTMSYSFGVLLPGEIGNWTIPEKGEPKRHAIGQ